MSNIQASGSDARGAKWRIQQRWWNRSELLAACLLLLFPAFCTYGFRMVVGKELPPVVPFSWGALSHPIRVSGS